LSRQARATELERNHRPYCAFLDREVEDKHAGEVPVANFGLVHYAIIFLVVALIAAAVGFGGVAGVAMEGARLLFWVFIVLFVVSLLGGLLRR